jgi:hypothetical protein
LQRDFVAGFAGGGGDLSDCIQQRLSLLAGDEQCPAEVVNGGLHGIALFFGIAESGYESHSVFGVVWDHGTFGVTAEFLFAFIEPRGGVGIEFCLLLDVGVRETFFFQGTQDGLVETSEFIPGAWGNFASEADAIGEVPFCEFLWAGPPGGFEYAGGGLELVDAGDEFAEVE